MDATVDRLSARKRPTQSRSQKTVARILDATSRLLKTNGADVGSLTTNHIAKEAGLSVGSLYQYFPNKEAILFQLFGDMLAEIRTVLSTFKTEEFLSMPRKEFFDRLHHQVKDAEADPSMVAALHHAMKTYPKLAEADRQHAESVADDLAFFMAHFGSKWTKKRLQRLGLYIYYLNFGGWAYRDHANPPRGETLGLEIATLNFVVAQCFEDDGKRRQ